MSDPVESRSRIELLKTLGARVKHASEHFAGAAGAAGLPRAERARKGPPLTELIPGSERVTFRGMSCVRIETRVSLDGARTKQGYACPAYGRATVDSNPGELDRQLGVALRLLARGVDEAAEIDPARVMFLDTETTSLSGGSGAVAFLAGLGRFDFSGVMPGFVVTQFFMEDYDQEEALIEALGAEIGGAAALGSYNGRCFDVPILESRWRMHRRKPVFPARHFDLLHPARRLWRRRLPDCRLGTLERQLLGLVRFSDVESALVPRIFNDYARGIQPGRILGVLDHHAQDIFSLGALLAHMARGLNNPEAEGFAQAEDQWGLSGIFQQAGHEEESVRCLERAAGCARDEDFGFRLAMHLARRLMRSGRTQDALDILHARAEGARHDRLDPLIELAKYHEHKLKDYDEARRWAGRAMELIHAGGGVKTEALRADLNKRLERLDHKSSASSGR